MQWDDVDAMMKTKDQSSRKRVLIFTLISSSIKAKWCRNLKVHSFGKWSKGITKENQWIFEKEREESGGDRRLFDEEVAGQTFKFFKKTFFEQKDQKILCRMGLRARFRKTKFESLNSL